MKSIVSLRLGRGLSLLTALVLVTTFASTATAAPTKSIAFGFTAVQLDPSFLAALDFYGITPEVVGRARINDTTVRFPIPGGALDLETLAGDIFHVGGLSLSREAAVVDLLNFIIDTTPVLATAGSTDKGGADCVPVPVLTGLVTVNGNVGGRLRLFNVTLSPDMIMTFGNILLVRGVELTVNSEAAAALKTVFPDLPNLKDAPVGTATLFALLR